MNLYISYLLLCVASPLLVLSLEMSLGIHFRRLFRDDSWSFQFVLLTWVCVKSFSLIIFSVSEARFRHPEGIIKRYVIFRV